jgi:uncharacterized membrane protein
MSPSTRRMVILSAVAVVVGAAAAAIASWQLAVLLAWIAACTVYLAIVWREIYRADGDATERSSTREDDSVALRGFITLAASVISLAGALFALRKASEVDGGAQPGLLTVAAVTTVVVSWLAVHTDFTLRYAHVYYTPPVGGVVFDGADKPDYRDFAYLSFTIGMTYQVSDTGLLTSRFRRVLLAHALLSYLFGVVIIASIINIVAGIVD